MANHHDTHNPGNEKKPVSFTVPLILGSVTVFIILLFVSLGDPGHGHQTCECKENCSTECMEACEQGDHSKHPADMKHVDGDAHGHGATEHHENAAPATEGGEHGAAADTTKKEEHHEAEHH
jgi:hypothetical protein